MGQEYRYSSLLCAQMAPMDFSLVARPVLDIATAEEEDRTLLDQTRSWRFVRVRYARARGSRCLRYHAADSGSQRFQEDRRSLRRARILRRVHGADLPIQEAQGTAAASCVPL
jgi:hypothetical protein